MHPTISILSEYSFYGILAAFFLAASGLVMLTIRVGLKQRPGDDPEFRAANPTEVDFLPRSGKENLPPRS